MKTFLIVILFLSSAASFSQSNVTALVKLEKQLIDLIRTEDSTFHANSKVPTIASKLKIQKKFIELLTSPGADKDSFDVLSSALSYEFSLFEPGADKLRVFQLFRFYNNYPDGSYNNIALVQYKTKSGLIKVFPLSDYGKFYTADKFHKNIAFEILELNKIKNRRGDLFLAKVHQGFMEGKKAINRVVYFFITQNDNYLILDKPVYKNEPFLVFTTTESNYLGDIQTSFEDSIPMIRAYFPINKFTRLNKTLIRKDETAVDLILRFDGTLFRRAEHIRE
jgi:hypothetical protein